MYICKKRMRQISCTSLPSLSRETIYHKSLAKRGFLKFLLLDILVVSFHPLLRVFEVVVGRARRVQSDLHNSNKG